MINDNGGEEIASSWRLIAQEFGQAAVIDQPGDIVANTDNLEASTGSIDVFAGVAYQLRIRSQRLLSQRLVV